MTQAQQSIVPSASSSSGEWRLVRVTRENVNDVPVEAFEYLRRAVDRNPRTQLALVLEEIAQEVTQLWTIDLGADVHAALVTEIVDLPLSRCLDVLYLGGDRMHEWKHLMDELEAFAREHECDAVRIKGRRGWGRVFPEYAEAETTFAKEL